MHYQIFRKIVFILVLICFIYNIDIYAQKNIRLNNVKAQTLNVGQIKKVFTHAVFRRDRMILKMPNNETNFWLPSHTQWSKYSLEPDITIFITFQDGLNELSCFFVHANHIYTISTPIGDMSKMKVYQNKQFFYLLYNGSYNTCIAVDKQNMRNATEIYFGGTCIGASNTGNVNFSIVNRNKRVVLKALNLPNDRDKIEYFNLSNSKRIKDCISIMNVVPIMLQ